MFDFLIRVGVLDQPHGRTSLADHLMGTAGILQSWGLSTDVVIAGLIHSIYGTEYYTLQVAEDADRRRVKSLVGEQPERLAYIFGKMDRESLYEHFLDPNSSIPLRSRVTGASIAISETERIDVAHMVFANWLEQVPRQPPEARLSRQREFAAMKPFLSSGARASMDQITGGVDARRA